MKTSSPNKTTDPGQPKNTKSTMNPEDREVCDRIMAVIKESGDKQEIAAKKLSITQEAISRIKNYKNVPSLALLRRIIKAYNVNPLYLLFNDLSAGKYLHQRIGAEDKDLIDKAIVKEHLDDFTEVLNRFKQRITGIQ